MVHWIDTNEIWDPFIYYRENATEEFVQQIDEELKRINSVLKVKVDYIIIEKAKKEFTEAVSCQICNGNFNQDKKVWDHCHITGKFYIAAYSACNLKLQIKAWKTPIPIVFHNFCGYNSYLVCESVRRSVNAH